MSNKSRKEEQNCNYDKCCDRKTYPAQPCAVPKSCSIIVRAQSIQNLAQNLFNSLGSLQRKVYPQCTDEGSCKGCPELPDTLDGILQDADSLLSYATSRLNELIEHVGE